MEARAAPARGRRRHHRHLLRPRGVGHRQGQRRGRAAQVGGHLSTAPGGRRLHAAYQDPRRAPHRAPAAGDRRRRRCLRRGPRRYREPDFRLSVRRPHHSPDGADPLAPHRRHPPHLAAARRCRPHHRSGVRRLRPQRGLLPGVGCRRRGGLRRPARGSGHLRFLHRQPGVRQPSPQVQDFGHRLPRGLRQGRHQRHRPASGPSRRRHTGLQCGCGRRSLRW